MLTRKWAATLLVSATLLGSAGFLLGAAPAMAATASITPSAHLQSGQSRIISASWGDVSPYKVNFQCHVAGCANFVTASTTTEGLVRTVGVATCTGLSATSTISITEAGGGTASTSTTTTWSRGNVC